MAASLTAYRIKGVWYSRIKLCRKFFERQILSYVALRKSSISADSQFEVLELLMDLCQNRHFLTSGHIRMGFVNSYGPLGAELKRNLISQWWKSVVLSREQVFGVETLHHLVTATGQNESSLKVLDNRMFEEIIKNEELTKKQMVASLQELLHKGGTLRKNLIQGAIEQYVYSLNLVNQKLPFGLAQIGVSYEPETISVELSDSVDSVSEVTSASLVWFSAARTSSQWLDYWVRQRLLWWRKFAIGPSKFISSDYQDNEGNKGTALYYNFPSGKEPIEVILNLGNRQLLQVHHGNGTKIQGRDGRKNVIPCVVSVSGNLDRGVMAYLCDSFHLEDSTVLKKKMQHRKVLKIHPNLAPIKVALNMGRGPTQELRQVCQGLCQELLDHGIAVWPGHLETVQSSMEQLCLKYDEMGVIFTIVISDSTLENGIVVLRNRDTTMKEMLHISEVKNFLMKYIDAASNI